MKILIVDDDSDQRQIRALLLSQAGFEVFDAGDAANGRAIAGTQRPSAAVIDLRLPTVEDGLALLRDLKALDPAIRLIVLTGSRASVLKTRPEHLLVDCLLIKPAPTATLIDALRGEFRGEDDRPSTRAAKLH